MVEKHFEKWIWIDLAVMSSAGHWLTFSFPKDSGMFIPLITFGYGQLKTADIKISSVVKLDNRNKPTEREV